MLWSYMELIRAHKPAGGMAVFWPYVYGLTTAAQAEKLPYSSFIQIFVKCIIGAFIMRSAACTVNDIMDRTFDAEVERTKSRPLASGRLSVSSAILFFVFQLVVNILFFSTFKSLAFWTAMFQLLPLSCIYPLLKRVTYWPQAWLGVAINFGFLVSWFEVKQDLHSTMYSMGVMMSGLWCWTMLYDTVYGNQDRNDDKKIGIWSTAVLFESNIKPMATCFSTGLLCMLCLFGIINNHGLPYFAFCVGGIAIYLSWIISSLDGNSPKSCWLFFTRNAYYLGAIIFCGMLADYVRVMETNHH